MAVELAPDGIRVNLIAPVMAPTALLQTVKIVGAISRACPPV